MKQLESKHLAPYLPYGLKFHVEDASEFTYILNGVDLIGYSLMCTDADTNDTIRIFDFTDDNQKPILRPLSDLTKKIEHNGLYFESSKALYMEFGINFKTYEIFYNKLKIDLEYKDIHLPYCLTQKLFEWHFDVFNLIENNLAIDINKI